MPGLHAASSAANSITLTNLPTTGSTDNNFGERVGSLAGAVYMDTDNDGQFAESAAEWQALRAFGERELPARVAYGRGSAPAVPDNSDGGDRTFPSRQLHFDSRGLVTPVTGRGVVYLRSTVDPTAVVAVSVSASGSARLWTYRNGTWQ